MPVKPSTPTTNRKNKATVVTAADLASHLDSGRWYPLWTHRACGGRVYLTPLHDFRCSRCKLTGLLSVRFSDRINQRDARMKYLLRRGEMCGTVDIIV
jgi:hypothetical protein